eukprot:RCo036773
MTDWIVKESRTHKGCFYKFNPRTAESKWIDPADDSAVKDSSLERADKPADAAIRMPMFRRPLTSGSRASRRSWGTEDTEGGSECICTICECGQHACNKHKWQPSRFPNNSRYREDFPAHPVKRPLKAAPPEKPELTPSDPDHFKTMYNNDFLPFTPARSKSMKPMGEAAKKVPFVGNTTYREMLSPKPITRQPYKRPPPMVRPSVPFDDMTTSKEYYKPHLGARPPESMAPQPHSVQNAPFDGNTCYKMEYVPHDPVASPRKRATAQPYDYGPPRKLPTEHRDEYTPKAVPRCPVLELPYKGPSEHTGHTHYSKNPEPSGGPRYCISRVRTPSATPPADAAATPPPAA